MKVLGVDLSISKYVMILSNGRHNNFSVDEIRMLMKQMMNFGKKDALRYRNKPAPLRFY